MTDFLMVAAGLVLLFFAGEALLKGSVSIALRMGLSKLLVGAVIIGFGTSMPEMMVSVGAALKGAPEIALGNVVGSNTANILLIIGLAAVLVPLQVSAAAVRRDVLAMLGAAAVLCVLAPLGALNAATGAVMAVLLVAYVVYGYRADRKKPQAAADAPPELDEKPIAPWLAIILCIGGLAGLMAGAHLLVTGAVSLARGFGISEAVIGLTIVAVGTSLPELATAVVASMRRQNEMVIGNILGSNIFNILCILGVTSLVKPIVVTGQIVDIDIWIMLAVTIFISAFLLRGARIGRGTGLCMMGAYMAYTLWLYTVAA